MKQLSLFLSLAALAAPVQAQISTQSPDTMPARMVNMSAPRFGYLSYSQTLHALPEYTLVRRNLEDLKAKYDSEMKRVEDEFNSKYEAFLEGQRDFAPSIQQKRQAELQELMEKNMAFKEQSQKLLQQAEKDAMQPLRDKLHQAINRVAQERNLAFVLNIDNDAVPFINPSAGVDISELVVAGAR